MRCVSDTVGGDGLKLLFVGGLRCCSLCIMLFSVTVALFSGQFVPILWTCLHKGIRKTLT